MTGAFDSGEPEPDADQKIEDGLYKNQLSLTVRRRTSNDSTSTESLDSIIVDFKVTVVDMPGHRATCPEQIKHISVVGRDQNYLKGLVFHLISVYCG